MAIKTDFIEIRLNDVIRSDKFMLFFIQTIMQIIKKIFKIVKIKFLFLEVILRLVDIL